MIWSPFKHLKMPQSLFLFNTNISPIPQPPTPHPSHSYPHRQFLTSLPPPHPTLLTTFTSMRKGVIYRCKLKSTLPVTADPGFPVWVFRVNKILFNGLASFDRYWFWHWGESHLYAFPALSHKCFISTNIFFIFQSSIFKFQKGTIHSLITTQNNTK